MQVRRHEPGAVELELGGEVLHLVECLDRYQAPRRPGQQGPECVEIWALPDGRVVRLSRAKQEGAPWVAQPWV